MLHLVSFLLQVALCLSGCSYESQFIQLTDLLIGAVCYKARGMDAKPDASEAKIKLIEYLEQKSGYVLNEGTEPSESKFNIFNHQPRRQ